MLADARRCSYFELGLPVTILELFPSVLATEIWGAIMRNHCIVFFSDNHAVVDIVNKQTSREPKIMVFVRRLVLNCLKYNILFKSKHISDILNRECDSLSRLQVDKFKLAPHADVGAPSCCKLDVFNPPRFQAAY